MMHDPVNAVAVELADFGGFLRCESCHETRDLSHLRSYLAIGWPKCCGYTMRWWTARQVADGEVPPTRRVGDAT